MAGAHRLHFQLSVSSLGVLEDLAKQEWTKIELVSPGVRREGMRAVANEIRIHGDRAVSIGAIGVDVGKRLEAFSIQADYGENGPAWASKLRPPPAEDAGELVSAFLGRGHRILVGTRLHRFPATDGGQDLEVSLEDVLIFRDASGRQAFIAPDQEQPGLIVLTRAYEDVPLGELAIEQVRGLL